MKQRIKKIVNNLREGFNAPYRGAVMDAEEENSRLKSLGFAGRAPVTSPNELGRAVKSVGSRIKKIVKKLKK